MSKYNAPLDDMRFILRELVDLDPLMARYPHSELTPDLVDTVLAEAGKFASQVLAPTNPDGDRVGTRWDEGQVLTAPGFSDAYRQFVDAGWHSLSGPTAFGGQGFPRVVSALADEIFRASNLALTGCVALTRGAIEALAVRAPDELKQRYLPHLVQGDWTGTMNLTEPQAGSDLSAIRTRAEPAADGSYRIFGQKIFISWGEHDMSENIVHLVLARTPDAPPGVKGISMFLVPRMLEGDDGTLSVRNDVHCLSIEHKSGQHGSPTTVLAYGDRGVAGRAGTGAIGYLVGELNKGLEVMFIMMNEARFAVGLEGLAVSERAYQTALDYARTRVQGVAAGGAPGVKVPIIQHPDVRRMLMQMKAGVEAMRALTVAVAAALDEMRTAPCAGDRDAAREFLDLMTPIYKGWNTELAQQLTSTGVQIHGGFGFMQECEASQHWRDARILPIYEGTTGIQASDLVGRKIARDGGRAALALAEQIASVSTQLLASESRPLRAIGEALGRAAAAIRACTQFVGDTFGQAPRDVLAVSVPLLRLFGLAAGGWQCGRAALAAHRLRQEAPVNDEFLAAKIQTSLFFAEHFMPEIDSLARQVVAGGASVLALTDAQF
jgi:alkylation response protein AidB-like acyl-CoA dehydrogenase